MSDKILKLFMGVFIGAWLARYLGPTNYGIYNYALSFVFIFTPFASLGLDAIVLRDMVRNPIKQDQLLGTTLVLKVCGGVFAFSVLLLVVLFIRQTDPLSRGMILIIGSGFLFQSGGDTLDIWFKSQVQASYVVIARNIIYFLMLGAKISLIYLQAPLIAFACAWSIEIALSSISLFSAYKFSGQKIRNLKFEFETAKELLIASWPVIFSGLAVSIYLKMDQILLGLLQNEKSVGIYAAAARISELWYFVPIAIVASVSPSIISSKSQNEQRYYAKLQQTLNLLAVLAYVVAIPVTLLSKTLILLLFGPDYIGSAPILAIHVWQGLFVFMAVVKSTWIVTEDLMKVHLATTTLGAVVNVALNLVLIPMYGPIGAACASVSTYLLSDYLIYLMIPYSRFRTMGTMMTKALILEFVWARILPKPYSS